MCLKHAVLTHQPQVLHHVGPTAKLQQLTVFLHNLFKLTTILWPSSQETFHQQLYCCIHWTPPCLNAKWPSPSDMLPSAWDCLSSSCPRQWTLYDKILWYIKEKQRRNISKWWVIESGIDGRTRYCWCYTYIWTFLMPFDKVDLGIHGPLLFLSWRNK